MKGATGAKPEGRNGNCPPLYALVMRQHVTTQTNRLWRPLLPPQAWLSMREKQHQYQLLRDVNCQGTWPRLAPTMPYALPTLHGHKSADAAGCPRLSRQPQVRSVNSLVRLQTGPRRSSGKLGVGDPNRPDRTQTL